MPTVSWNGNAPNVAQVATATVTAVATNGQLIATMNGKQVIYTCVSSDTTTSAVAAWQALLSAQGVPPEFTEATWTASGGVLTATATTPGTPFTVVFSAQLGATVVRADPQPNQSQSDVFDARNWLRAGVAGLPQNGDDMNVGNSSVPLLWNLDKLAAVQVNSYTRWQSFTGTIGLPENNPLGYFEYRPTYFQFSGPPLGSTSSGVSSSSAGPTGVLNMILGYGPGGGPGRERYNVGGQQVNLQALASGQPLDAVAIRFLGNNAANVFSIVGTTLGVAALPGETAALASAQVGSGAGAWLGSGVTMTGTLTVTAGTALLNCAPGNVIIQQGGQLQVTTPASAPAPLFPSVVAQGGARVTWLSGASITTLKVVASSTFDKSQDLRAMVVTSLTMDADTCQVLDPASTITFVNPVVLNNAVQSGPFTFAPGHTIKVA